MKRFSTWLVAVLALAFVFGVAAPVLALDTNGTVKSISADKNEFVMTDKNGKDWTIQVPDTAKVRLGTNDLKFRDLKVGDEVTIVYDKDGDLLKAREITVKRK